MMKSEDIIESLQNITGNIDDSAYANEQVIADELRSLIGDIQVNDTIVEQNVEFLRSRSRVGLKKYGVTLDREDLTPVEWVQHLREELADALNYATVVQGKLKSYE